MVPPDSAQNVVETKWIYRIKRDPIGVITQYKARLVGRGFHQREDIDYTETYSPFIKPATIRVVLTLAITNGWKLRQLDINNAFLQGQLHDDIFVQQPSAYSDATNPHYVCKLNKALYGLKQAPRTWLEQLSSFLLSLGFKNFKSDSSLFVYLMHNIRIYVLIYVDNINSQIKFIYLY